MVYSGMYLETGPDKLYTLIIENERISLSEAAKELKTSKDIVEAWADAIEESGAIHIEVLLSDKFFLSSEFSKIKMINTKRVMESLKFSNATYENKLNEREKALDARSKKVIKDFEKASNLKKENSKLSKEFEAKKKELKTWFETLEKKEVLVNKKLEKLKIKELKLDLKIEKLNALKSEKKSFKVSPEYYQKINSSVLKSVKLHAESKREYRERAILSELEEKYLPQFLN